MSSSAATPTALMIDASFLVTQMFHAAARGPDPDLDLARRLLSQRLAKLQREHAPQQTLMAVDLGRTWRHEEYGAYKQGRKAKHPELRQLRSEIQAMAAAQGVPCYRAPSFEADDVLAALALRAAAKGWQVVIYSADLDLMQLCSPQICVQAPAATYTPEVFGAKYGFAPERLPVYKAVAGDSSDNIPGVSGLGDRSAAALAQGCQSVRDVWDRMLEHPKRVQGKLMDARLEDVLLYERLARLTPPAPEQVVRVKDGELETHHEAWQASAAS